MQIKDKYYNLCIIIFFAVLSSLMIILGLRYGRLILMFDWLFHSSRAQEIYNNLQEGQIFTFISTSTVQHIGSGTFLFYPTLFLYPWAIIHLITNAVSAYYIWYGIVTFLTFYIAYICMEKFSGNKLMSLFFSLAYTGNTYRLGIAQHMIGEFIVAAFLPIVFLGFYELFFGKKDRGCMFSIGMSLVLWTHLLTAFILVEIFIAILLIYIIVSPNRKQIIYRINSLLWSILLTVVLSVGFLYQFVFEMSSGKVSTTLLQLLNNSIPNLQEIILLSLGNSDYMNTHSIGLILIIALLLGWYFVKKSKLQLNIYIIGILLLLISSSIFPWYLFVHTPLILVQMPHRYLLFATLFLSISASYIFENLISKYGINKYIVVVVLACSFILLYFGSQAKYYAEIRNYNPNTYLKKNLSGQSKTLPFAQVDNKNYEYQFDYKETFGESDYLPQKSVNSKALDTLINNIAYVNGRKVVTDPQSEPNRIINNLNIDTNGSTIDLPIVAYRDTYVILNGKKVPFKISERGSVKLNNLLKGKSRIVVGYSPSRVYYYMVGISTIGWLVLLIMFIFRRKNAINYQEIN